jgi:uncharacterized membrane protein YkoI
MNSWKTGSLVVIAIVGGLTPAAFAKDRELKKSEVPAPVMKAVTTRYPNAQPNKFELEEEKGTTLYSVKIDVAGHPTELMVSPEGSIVAEEQIIEVSELPASVKSTLSASPYGKAKILRAEKELKGADTRYELLVEEQGKKTEVVIDAGGKLIKHEEKSGEHEEEAD